jgi:galactokinase
VAALLRETGHQVGGANLVIDGDLPIGAGLSSSASLELGTMVAFAALADYSIDAAALARLGQRVENEIIGVQSGIMDQLAIASGAAGHAVLIDCRSLETQPIPIPDSLRVLVLDSAVPRTLAGSAYNDRRAECEAALHILQVRDPGLRALRDVSEGTLTEQQRHLPDRLLRRARHVVTENHRVLDAVAALRRTDVERLGQLLTESHASLRDDYQVSIPELDTLVDIALRTPGVLGARLTGAGSAAAPWRWSPPTPQKPPTPRSPRATGRRPGGRGVRSSAPQATDQRSAGGPTLHHNSPPQGSTMAGTTTTRPAGARRATPRVRRKHDDTRWQSCSSGPR